MLSKKTLVFLLIALLALWLHACTSGGNDKDGIHINIPDGDVADGDTTTDGDDTPDGRLTTCYTPCKAGIMRDGEYIPCSDEGLLEGCIGDTVCQDGWCVLEENVDDDADINSRLKLFKEGDSSQTGDGSCESDCDCPEHGTCINGMCGGNCERGSQKPYCSDGYECHKKVCRKVCTTGSESGNGQNDTCSDGTYCEVGSDGSSGYCLPLCQPEDTESPDEACLLSVQGTGQEPFELGGTDMVEDILNFTEDRTEATFQIVNNTLCTLNFTITKLSHIKYDGEGSTLVETNPLYWVTIQSGDIQDEDGVLNVEVEPQSTADISILNAFNEEIPNWNGEIEIKND